MAGYSARVETYSDNDTITAAHSNNEFNQVLAAFNSSTGHNHDGTAGEGARVLALGPNGELTAGATEVVVNESGAATVDFRVEMDNFSNGLLVDASADTILVGNAQNYGGLLNVHADSSGGKVVVASFGHLEGATTSGAALRVSYNGTSGLFNLDAEKAGNGSNTNPIKLAIGASSASGGSTASTVATFAVDQTAFSNSNTSHAITIANTSNTTPSGIRINLSGASPDNNSQSFISCEDSTTARCIIWSDGDIVNHDNSYGAISDESTKQDISDASSQWDDIKALRIRRYRAKEDATKDEKAGYHIGVIAQEVELTSPGVVMENPDGLKAVQYSLLYVKALKALQEAMAKIEDLETRVATLEGK